MHSLADGAEVRAFLARVARRRRALAALRGAAWGLAVALSVALAAWVWLGDATVEVRAVAFSLALLGAGTGAAAALLRLRRAEPAAAVVERALPGSRNVVTTAAELADTPAGVSPYVAGVVAARAAALLRGLAPGQLLPAARPVAGAAAAVVAWAATLLLMVGRPAALPTLIPVAAAAAAERALALEIVVTPPAYTGEPARTLRDPARVEAVAGSMLRVTVRAAVHGVAMETVAGRRELDAAAGGNFTATVLADADGFLALETRRADGTVAERRLVGLSVVPDHAPRVRVTTPARDLMLPDGNATVALEVEAEDDFGLASLKLRYTRVTGFGEQFTFLEGEVPLEVTRLDMRRWTGRAAWSLAPLELEPGDMVVYRAVAGDRRPGAPEGESDTFMVEILSGPAALAGGFAGDEELDRYALSQQMIVVLTERLMARRGTLTAEAFKAEARVLAAAQRRVRAEFVFMLGGELDDEDHHEDGIMEVHEEAHQRADEAVLEGRMASQGRLDLMRAIRAMSSAATLLTDVEMAEALRAEQTALVFLQRAFARSRYILRALTERERLDLSRRLTGTLATAVRDVRPRVEPEPEPAVAELRAVLASAAAHAGAAEPGGQASAELAALAQRVLRVDASSEALRAAATLLSDAGAAAASGRGVESRHLLGDAVTALAAEVRVRLAPAPAAGPPASVRRLEGALTDALRAGGAP